MDVVEIQSRYWSKVRKRVFLVSILLKYSVHNSICEFKYKSKVLTNNVNQLAKFQAPSKMNPMLVRYIAEKIKASKIIKKFCVLNGC